jgi:hypothetical protein
MPLINNFFEQQLMGISMTSKNLCVAIVGQFLAICLTISLGNADVEIRKLKDGTIRFEAHESSLKEISQKISDEYTIEVKGLDKREGEKFTFSFFADTLEELLKRLLRCVGIQNYAFEFSEAKLKRLVVVPAGTTNAAMDIQPPQAERKAEALTTIAQIHSIVEGTQAESAGLQEGDIVLEYDGVSIRSAQQLVREVEKKSTNSQVEIVVLRQKIKTRLILSGGFIGVRIMTKSIPRTEFETYQDTD